MSEKGTQQAKKWLDRLSPRMFRFGLNLWPPFLGSGIKVTLLSSDYRRVEVSLTLHWYNQNYVGTHFGGAMYAMTDPFYMLILLKNLGREYIVWDKAGMIAYKKPARGIIRATFTFSDEEIQDIRRNADQQPKYVFDKSVSIFNAQNEEVASVVKTIFVKRKELVKGC